MAESNNLIKVKYVLDTSEFDKLSKDEVRAKQELQKFNQELRNTAKEGKQATTSVKSGLDGINSSASSLKSTIGGLFTVGALVGFAKEIFKITGEFQRFEAVLKNSLGTSSAAYSALKTIKDFAATTPFAVTELTAAYIKLANQGFKPTANQLKLLGDLASSTGKSFDQLTEAIIDAQTGEFERLKEFGIRASKAGDQIIFTFKGVKTETKFTTEAIRDYILSLGKLEGVSGSMAAISKTMEGQISNIGDAWDNLMASLGGGLLGQVYQSTLAQTSDFLAKLNSLFKNDRQKEKDRQAESFERYSKEVQKLSDEALKNVSENAQKERQRLLEEDKKNEKQFIELSEKRKKLAQSSSGGNFFSRKARLKEIDEEIKELQAGNKKRMSVILDLYAQEDAVKQEFNNRDTNRKKQTTGKTEEQLKKEFDAQMKLLDLLRERDKLEAQLRNSTQGVIAADEQYYTQRAKLEEEYFGAGGKISKLQIQNSRLNAEKANRDRIQETIRNSQTIGGIIIKSDEEITKKKKELQEQQFKDSQQITESIEKDADAARERTFRKEEEQIRLLQQLRQEAIQQAYGLAENLASGLFNLQQANLQNELAMTQKKYAEEIRLAGDNKQRVTELEEKQAQKEKELRIKMFRSQQQSAIANAVFKAAPYIIEYTALLPASAANLALTLGALATETALILAQPVPEFKEGTKGKKFMGKAIVGEAGVEKVVTESGKVYFTPPTATLADFKEPVQIIPNHSLNKNEIFWASQQTSSPKKEANPVIQKLDEINSTLNSLPIHQITLNKKGFETFVTTSKRTTKILNNQFPTRK